MEWVFFVLINELFPTSPSLRRDRAIREIAIGIRDLYFSALGTTLVQCLLSITKSVLLNTPLTRRVVVEIITWLRTVKHVSLEKVIFSKEFGWLG